MDLKITLRNHYEAIFHAAFVSIGMVIILFYLFHRYEYHPSFIIAFAVWYGISVIPGLYLHLEYYLKNKGEEYTVNSDSLMRRKNGDIQEYKSDKIEKIMVYMSPNLYKNWYIYFFSMDQYHYACVFLKDGGRLYITCLLAPRVDKALSSLQGVRVEKRKSLFSSTYIPESWY